MNILTTLQALNTCFAPSGQESSLARKLEDYVRPYADDVYTDTLGNLIVHKRGPGAKVMLAAHMDSIGFIVTYIEKEGFLRVGAIGGVQPHKVLASPVRFRSGTMGVVYQDEGADDAKISDLFLDIGAKSGEEAKKLVSVGDAAIYAAPTFRTGEAIVSPYLDDRIACVVLLAVLEQLKESENDLWFVFTTQEEVGTRGAQTAAYGVAPDYGLAVDVTVADDLPGTKHEGGSAKAGGGAAIKVMDNSVVSHPFMVKTLRELAEEKGIAWQMDILRRGGTDAGAIHKSRGGVISGGISVPCRYAHSPTEMVYESDVMACIDLLAAFCATPLPKLPRVEE